LRPTPTGIVLIDVPAELRGKVTININGEQLREPDGSLSKADTVVRTVRAGKALVVVCSDGYECFKQQIVVKEGTEFTQVSPRLVMSTPPGATILVAGKSMGTTPGNLSVLGGTTELTLQRKCFDDAIVPVKLPAEPKDTITVLQTLKKRPGCR